MAAIRLIVGLGNPGAEYAATRHNAGAWFAERVAQRLSAPLRSESKFFGLYGRAGDVHILLPQTFMNLSGRAVGALAHFYKILPDEILVAHDELDLAPGVARLKLGGGHGGLGIVGLPNVGKSTTFNALTKAQNAEAANYPFCTIEPNKAIVPVPDPRIAKLVEIVKPQRVQYATVEFVDIAGLVKGASKGEGLGNQFLGNIRETQAIVHVVRCFEDANVIHVNAQPDPKDDIETIQTELLLADLQQLEKKIDKLKKQAKTDKKLQAQLDLAEALAKHLESGEPASNFADRDSDTYRGLEQEMKFITGKKVIYAANVDEAGLSRRQRLRGHGARDCRPREGAPKWSSSAPRWKRKWST
jgi:hypothetical protein